ncbi:30S ribosomal protein S21 [Candidatus Roizmanbacteria bacterium]|nr:30S ribosomal protein S21 [Candidatus Roizmanbacteria bacterium]
MVFVKAKKGDSNDSLIRKFVRKITEENLMQQIKDLQFYKTPSELRKERKNRFRKK